MFGFCLECIDEGFALCFMFINNVTLFSFAVNKISLFNQNFSGSVKEALTQSGFDSIYNIFWQQKVYFSRKLGKSHHARKLFLQ